VTASAAVDLALAPSLAAAMAVAALQPAYLLLLTRVDRLRGRNAWQFLLSAVATLAIWAGLLAAVPALRPAGAAEAALAAMGLAAGVLFYLNIWGLMSRGYTLGMLLTLHRAGRPLTATEIRHLYRGGEALEWIMRHRLGAMRAAGVIEGAADAPVLTSVRGVLVARLYLLCAACLGLARER
jgi:hypothetical protein